MNKQDIIKQMRIVIEDVFGIRDADVESLNPDNVSDWNSLRHVMLMDAIEKAFDIHFELDEMLEIVSMKDIIQVLDNKLNG